MNPALKKSLTDAWRKTNPGAAKASDRKWELKKFYGLTVPQFNAMVLAQGGCCAICDSANPGLVNGKQRDWSVDHDHATGVVRGLLCRGCNTGLGHFMDDPARLLAAERYIQFHKKKKMLRAV